MLIKMASEVVTIPKKEYELLLKCKHIVESEFEEDFSEEFIKAIKESEEAYKRGELVRVKNSEERRKLFDSL
ncbi:hypothetical protein HYX00_03950 [Candidatus Woesearchaeota archaeon]|nr:hypothetical protein [Candidatus Woesearchaeota archaeon]